jgi:4-diphosphocytidyl-2-C-methyl-D-erythritol kinase
MSSYSLIAPAKINLYLEIIGDRPDGFHELVMILQSIALADQIDLKSNGTARFSVTCDDPDVPTDDSNLVYKAATLMATTFGDAYRQYGAADIVIHKRVPMGAGLAGGSADAAAVLVGLNLMWHLGLTQSELQDLAAQLGSDIPFCVTGGTAIATGRGEQLDALTSLDNLYVVLAKYRSIGISTPWAYKAYRQQFEATYARDISSLSARRERFHSGDMVRAIAHKDLRAIGQALHNDLEKVVLPDQPKVLALRQRLQAMEPVGVMMSGSGSTVFALVEAQQQAEAIAQQLRQDVDDPDLGVWVTKLTSTGIHLAQL